MLKRKGQESGSGAAILVAIITFLIILYILFIPPAEREKILGVNETEEEGANVSTAIVHNKTLLTEQPGKIFYLPQKEIEHELPTVNLYTKTEGVIVKEIDSISVKKALFIDKKQNMTFVLEYPEYTSSVLLSFNLLRSTGGELIIKLNGVEIFNKEVSGIVEPIKLPNEFLKRDNVIEIEASGIGFVFWKVHDFIMENIKITADITETAASESKSIFLVSSSEKDNIDVSSLRIYAGCKRDQVGRLIIEINGYEIFSGIPNCGQVRTYQFSPEKLMEGENILRFKSEEGHYLLDQIMVKTELTEPEQYVWFFRLTAEEYKEAKEDDIDINFSVEFVDDSYKEGYFIINGYETGFSSKNLVETWVINPYLREGGNTIKLDPKNNMFITDLRVFIE